MKDRIKQLLGAGLPASLVATAVGCDPSYISQLLADPAFAEDVASLKICELEELQKRDGKYDKLEDEFLKKLEALLPMMLKPRDVLSALQIINGAKRRSAELRAAAPQTPVINNVVVLQLPNKTVNTFELNKANEVVSINEKPMVALPTQALMRLIEAKEKEKEKSSNEQQIERSRETPTIPKRFAERIVNENSI